jgi:hypothetical protein
VKVEEYILEDGASPYRDWFDALDAEAAAKVTTAMVRMERGLISAIKWFDGIGELGNSKSTGVLDIESTWQKLTTSS